MSLWTSRATSWTVPPRRTGIGGLARRLRIDPDNLERCEQEWRQCVEPVAGLGGHRERGKLQPQKILEDLDFLRVGIEVALVGYQHSRQIEAKRIDRVIQHRRGVSLAAFEPRPFRRQENLLVGEALDDRRDLFEALRVAHVDDQQRGIRRLQGVDEPRLHEIGRDRWQVDELNVNVLVCRAPAAAS